MSCHSRFVDETLFSVAICSHRYSCPSSRNCLARSAAKTPYQMRLVRDLDSMLVFCVTSACAASWYSLQATLQSLS